MSVIIVVMRMLAVAMMLIIAVAALSVVMMGVRVGIGVVVSVTVLVMLIMVVVMVVMVVVSPILDWLLSFYVRFGSGINECPVGPVLACRPWWKVEEGDDLFSAHMSVHPLTA